jgi:hypothetical protein
VSRSGRLHTRVALYLFVAFRPPAIVSGAGLGRVRHFRPPAAVGAPDSPPQSIGERIRKAPLVQTDEQRSLASFTPALQCTARHAEPFGERCFGQAINIRHNSVFGDAQFAGQVAWHAWHVRTDRPQHGPVCLRRWQFICAPVSMADRKPGRVNGACDPAAEFLALPCCGPCDEAGRRGDRRIPARLIDLEVGRRRVVAPCCPEPAPDATRWGKKEPRAYTGAFST